MTVPSLDPPGETRFISKAGELTEADDPCLRHIRHCLQVRALGAAVRRVVDECGVCSTCRAVRKVSVMLAAADPDTVREWAAGWRRALDAQDRDDGDVPA